MGRDTELEYNIAKSRIEMIGQVVNAIRYYQMQLEHNGDLEHAKKYHTTLKSLAMEITPYIESEDEVKDLKTRIKKLKPDSIGGYNKNALEELDHKLNKKRIQLGLDIPQKTRPEEGKELLEGSSW